MSSNRHKTTICNVCGKVMCNYNLKRHLRRKHANDYKLLQHGNIQHNANVEDEIRTETCGVPEMNELLVSDDRKLESGLERDNEVYKKNVTVLSIFLYLHAPK